MKSIINNNNSYKCHFYSKGDYSGHYIHVVQKGRKIFLCTFFSFLNSAIKTKPLLFMNRSIHKVEEGNLKKAVMGKFYITLISLCGLLLSTHVAWAQCPSLVKYEVRYEESGTDSKGIIRFFLNEEGSPSTPLVSQNFQYNLWDKSRGVYLYNPSKLDAGFYEDKKISFSLKSNVAEFRNVPPGDNYFMVIYSDECNKVIGPDGGVAVNNSMSR